jgi:hypothetical protein
MPDKDSIKKVCTIFQYEDNTIITFEDFISSEYKRPYEEIKDLPEVKKLRKAWNASCDSLLNILNEISQITKEVKK